MFSIFSRVFGRRDNAQKTANTPSASADERLAATLEMQKQALSAAGLISQGDMQSLIGTFAKGVDWNSPQNTPGVSMALLNLEQQMPEPVYFSRPMGLSVPELRQIPRAMPIVQAISGHAFGTFGGSRKSQKTNGRQGFESNSATPLVKLQMQMRHDCVGSSSTF